MPPPNETLRVWQRSSLGVAAVGLVMAAAISWNRPVELAKAYLTGFMVCWPVTLGAAGLLAIANLTGGRWAQAARPMYLAAARTIQLVAVLFIPIALSVAQIYPWADPSRTGLSLPSGKAAYLDPTFFVGRAGGYLGVWLVVIGLLCYVSRPSAEPISTPAMRRAGALSLVLLVPTATFAAFDWAMSLEPDWYSSIYGAIITAAGVLASHALAIVGLVATRDHAGLIEAAAAGNSHLHDAGDANEPAREERVAQVYNDLGNLQLAFLMVFGYLAFSQFLIIWSGNLPSEITWYLRRLSGWWQWLALAIVGIAWVAFFQMLSRDRKRTPQRLSGIAGLLIVTYGIHTYWNIVPAFGHTGPAWHATNTAAIATLAGGWLAMFFWHARRGLNATQSDLGRPDVNRVNRT